MTEQCQAITRRSASNLALAFILLPKAKRRAMSALYAFCREVDDVADDEAVPVNRRREGLNRWREDVRLACLGKDPEFIVNRELKQFINQYHLPFEYFDELIRGCEMDLDINRYKDFAELEQYCYRVASVVGLLSIQIFRYRNPRTRDYAVYLGKALQLTNILRDVRTDAERGRIYLPLSELERFRVTPEEILRSEYSDRFLQLAESVGGQARKFYALAREALPAEDRRNMIAAELMDAVYWRLLLQLERKRFNVFGAHPIRLSKAHKLMLIVGAWSRLAFGAATPNYGTA
jgi:phytoene synthase